MSHAYEISSLIQDIAQRTKAEGVHIGAVKSVDEGARTCVVDVDGVLYYDVLLQSIENAKEGALLIPKTGSKVMIAKAPNSEVYRLLMYSEIEKVELKIAQHITTLNHKGVTIKTGATQAAITEEGVGVKVGAIDLAAKIDELIDAIMQITVATPSGTSGTPTNAAAFIALKTSFNSLLKKL